MAVVLRAKYGQTQTVYFPRDVWLKITEESRKQKVTISGIITESLRSRYELIK